MEHTLNGYILLFAEHVFLKFVHFYNFWGKKLNTILKSTNLF